MSNEVYQGIKAGLEDAIAYANGDTRGSVTHHIEVDVPDAAKIRGRVGLSQERFARVLRISVHTLRGWEQGRRRPRGPAAALLTAFEREPEAMTRALHEELA
jgi:putative transcriptional regulator